MMSKSKKYNKLIRKIKINQNLPYEKIIEKISKYDLLIPIQYNTKK